ncbi:MAG: FtsX-like permease family protein [Acidimicrobiia bacterium]|nr:FtsX-like permease family protein [Acidimicrobiia bacterium]
MARSSLRLWLRWSRRDLRRRWVLVSAIAFIIAIGTGVFSALGSTAEWRRQSNDASYGLLRMHDLRVALSTGSYVDAGALAAVARSTGGDASVVATAERLTVPTQVDASTAEQTILVPGRIVGLDLAGGVEVNRPWVEEGAAPDGTGAGPEALLEQKFAGHYDLPESGTVRIAGDREVTYTGLGTTPEYFMVTDSAAGLFAEANFAVLFMPIDDAQELAGHAGKVNDLVVRLAPGADLDAAKETLAQQFAEDLPDVGVTLTTRDEDPVYRVLYEDIENDQKVWNLFAVLILMAAAFASFNLISRIVDAERREIGVGMALGAPPRLLAVRPMLVGVQVALIGVVAGIGVGFVVMSGMRSLFVSALPLPVWKTPIQLDKFAVATALGLALPIIATVIPVWRAVRVEPVDAIRTGPGAERRRARGSPRGWPMSRCRAVWSGRCRTATPCARPAEHC